ncbi:MAG: FGGY family carbohydrate kinase [Jatrophihabitans sp.]
MTTTDTVIGLDLGTTTSKVLIRPLDRTPALVAERHTPWCTNADSETEIDPHALLRTATDLVGRAVRIAESEWGSVAVRAVSVTGFAESGVILDPSDRPGISAIAWFDRRGQAELDAIMERTPEFVTAFSAMTGLPWSFQASFAKMLWLTATNRIPAGSTWLSVPEWIVHGLGGDLVREPSLASRTGLIRQDTAQPWDDAVAIAGVPAQFLPDAAPAGTPVGKLDYAGAPSAASEAVLSVAGHDHPVAALAVGAVAANELFNSTGTADVLARAVPSTLTNEHRAAIVAARWSAGAHIVPNTDVLLAGGSGGLLLRRVLTALGVEGSDARDTLDVASMQVTALPPGLSIGGDGRTQEDVEIRLRDNASPAAIWTAATAYTAELARRMLADIEPIVGPHRRAVAAGGWTRMHSVRTAKSMAIGQLEFSDTREPGATGAALLAEYSLTADTRSLPEFLHDASQSVDA